MWAQSLDGTIIGNAKNTYTDLSKWRQETIKKVSNDHTLLNEFHDDFIQRIVRIAISNLASEWGEPPAHFAFFMMGSAARFEQSIWSDQDHGIVYDASGEHIQKYFLQLGEEISNGLELVGYEKCEGKIMASNPQWCMSLTEWRLQIMRWFEEDSWDSNRYLLTFFDSRVFLGEKKYIRQLRTQILESVNNHPTIMRRMLENVSYQKKAIGLFGQILVESQGTHTGCIHFKNTVLFPYVNALRLLAMKENIFETATISRFQQLPESYQDIKKYENDFLRLLSLRLHYTKNCVDYESVHYVKISTLSKNDKKVLKQLIGSGYRLFAKTRKLIEKGCST